MTLKAYTVEDINRDYGSTVVFAENAGKAKAKALLDDLFEDCEYIEMRATRNKSWDKYAKTQHIPIEELLDAGWWFCCDICGERLDYDNVAAGEAFIVNDEKPCGFVLGQIICKECKEKLEVANENSRRNV